MKALMVNILCFSLLLVSLPRPSIANDGISTENSSIVATSGEDIYKTDSALTFLSLTSMGVFLASLGRYKPLTTDMKIAAAAGILLVTSEIMGLVMTEQKLKDKQYNVNTSNTDLGNVQIDALEKEKKSFEDMEKFAALKWKIQAAASAAFLAAAGSAFFLHAGWVKARGACGATILAAGCAPASAAHISQESVVHTPSALTSTASLRELGSLQTTKMNALYACQAAYLAAVPVSSIQVQAAAVAIKSCSAESKIQLNVTTREYIKSDKILSDSFNSLPELYSKSLRKPDMNYISLLGSELFELLIGRAHAIKLSTLGLGAVALGVVLKMSKVNFPFLDKLMSVPLQRGIAYSAVAALAGASGVMSKRLENAMKENQGKIDQVINQVKSSTEVQSAIESINSSSEKQLIEATLPTATSFNNDIQIEGKPFPCPEGQSTDEGCSKLGENLSDSFAFKMFAGKSAELAKIATTTANTSDGIIGASTLSGSSLQGVNELSGKSALARKKVDEIQDDVNAMEKFGKRKPTNFKLRTEKLVGNIKSSARKSLQDARLNPRNILGIFRHASISPEEELGKYEEAATEDVQNVTDLEQERNLANISPKAKERSNEFFFDFDDSNENVVKTVEGLKHVDASKEDFDLQNIDIVKKPDVSIFDVITNRYLRSGYPRLFKIKEEEK